MKITRVSTAVVAGNFPWVLVKVETDEGVTGLGEAYWGVGVAELVHKAAPVIVGQNPFDINRLYEMMIRCLSGEGSQGGTQAEESEQGQQAEPTLHEAEVSLRLSQKSSEQCIPSS